MNEMNPLVVRLIEAKERRRKTLAAMSLPEKVRAVVTMQKMVYPLLKSRNPRACIWRIEEINQPGSTTQG